MITVKYFWNEDFNTMHVSTRLIIESHLDRFGLPHTAENLQAVMEFLSSIEENDFNMETGHKITMVAGEIECQTCRQNSLNGGLGEKCPEDVVI